MGAWKKTRERIMGGRVLGEERKNQIASAFVILGWTVFGIFIMPYCLRKLGIRLIDGADTSYGLLAVAILFFLVFASVRQLHLLVGDLILNWPKPKRLRGEKLEWIDPVERDRKEDEPEEIEG